MQIDVHWHEYGVFGGRASYAAIGMFLVMDAPPFGSNFTRIELKPHLSPKVRPKKPDVDRRAYLDYLDTLPLVRVERKRGTISIEYLSHSSKGPDTRNGVYTLDWFRQVYREVYDVLALVEAHLKKNDDFDFAAFMAWIAVKESHLPEKAEEFSALMQVIADARRQRCDLLDEWEKLDIDWEEFHPTARTLLDDTFFWDCVNDFSPHGNDTGADILEFFKGWRQHHRGASSQTFLANILDGWEVKRLPPPDDEFSISTHRDAVIGLAFAHLKFDGSCPAWCRDAALAEIEQERTRVTAHDRNRAEYDECLKSLAILSSKLKNVPVV